MIRWREPARVRSEIIIVGGGLAGLSAAIYLGRARRNTLLIDSGKTMARREPHVQKTIRASLKESATVN
ncbi:MAG TPA: FAD-dependent oxidoreductase [Candidatus Paceibacterota bacterium]|nr:FAD-dependent oxidoreductase [Candidatus Paceibacterota bacterium]